MPDILVTENIVGAAMDRLQEDFEVAVKPQLWADQAALKRGLTDVRALIVRNQTQVTAEVIEAGKALQMIARAGAGLDNIDVQAASEAGIVVSYAPKQNSLSVAELTLGVMLGLARKIPGADVDTKAGQWSRDAFTGSELFGKTLGIIGFGKIGFLVAMRARAFGMRILAHDEFIDSDAPTVIESHAAMVSLDNLLDSSDYVSCHLPSTPQTRGMFSRDLFDRMRSTAFLVNLARGELVDEPALIEALQGGRIAGAALDVRQAEPPPRSALNEMDNVILTPHVGAFTREAQQRVVACVCRDVAAVLSGQPATSAVNFTQPRQAADAPA